jgi:hypothetical protein
MPGVVHHSAQSRKAADRWFAIHKIHWQEQDIGSGGMNH